MLHFTADTHYWHKNILSYCGRTKFMTKAEELDYRANPGGKIRISTTSIELMNNELIDLTNKYVQPDDILIHNGDFCFGDISQMRAIRRRIPCSRLYLVIGNHDKEIVYNLEPPPWKDRSLSMFKIPPIGKISGVFDAVFARTELNYQGETLSLNHYAQVVWNKSHHGASHLYGHSHASLEPWMNVHLPASKTIDIGVDNIYRLYGEYRPVSFDEFYQRFSTYKTIAVDHHR